MAESLAERLSGTKLKEALLSAAVSEGVDSLPPDFEEEGRFVVCAVRAVASRPPGREPSVFVYSEAPLPDGRPHGFSRVMHMQDGRGEVSGATVLTGQDANNGALRSNAGKPLETLADELDGMGMGGRITVVWDPATRVATVYPEGMASDQLHVRFAVPSVGNDLTQDEVCEVLDTAYKDNLKNPSGRTARLWVKGQLVGGAEEEIERHLRGQLAMFFAGRSRPIRVLSQTNTAAGRTDLVFLQREDGGSPRLCGVLELKVLRGPHSADIEVAREGLSQGYHYRAELRLPFSTLALYDVTDPPGEDPAPLLPTQDPRHVAEVRVRRFAIFGSPKAWRDSANTKAA